MNLERMVTELSALANGKARSASSILPIAHPQLDGVNANLVKADRTALALMGAAYQALASAKLELREALTHGSDTKDALTEGIDAVIDGFATLYLWEEHRGVPPSDARSTRSWHVRDWMKAHSFPVSAFPDMHLRDEVVERLRTRGMTLTPRPLTHTAHEYYSMQYDRMADPNAPFGRRKEAKAKAETVEEPVDEPQIETEVADEPEADEAPVIHTAQEPAAEVLPQDGGDVPSDPVRQN